MPEPEKITARFHFRIVTASHLRQSNAEGNQAMSEGMASCGNEVEQTLSVAAFSE